MEVRGGGHWTSLFRAETAWPCHLCSPRVLSARFCFGVYEGARGLRRSLRHSLRRALPSWPAHTFQTMSHHTAESGMDMHLLAPELGAAEATTPFVRGI